MQKSKENLEQMTRGIKLLIDMKESGEESTDGSVKVEELTQIPAGANPFHYDSYHMGVNVGNCTIMYSSHDTCNYMIIVTPSGRRMKVILSEELMK